MRLAVCCINRRVSPLINHSKEIFITSISRKKQTAIQEVHITRLTPSIFIDILRSQKVKVLICGGIQEEYKKALMDNNIKYIENVIGSLEEVVKTYMAGNLHSNTIVN